MAADQPYFYAGADIGTTKGEGSSERKSGYGAFAGYQINSTFALEGGYRRVVHYDASFDVYNYHVRIDQLALSVLGSIPLNQGLSLYGRLGYNRLNFSARGDLNEKIHETEPLLGVGLAYSFTPTVSARLELQRPIREVVSLNAGVSFRF